MRPDQKSRRASWQHLILRRTDQVVVAGLIVVALIVIIVHLWHRGALRGRLIEVSRARPSTIRFQVDINSAEWPEFTLLPGIGETTARRIVAYRDQRGRFEDHFELMEVDGVGPKTVINIRQYLLPIESAKLLTGGDEEGAVADSETSGRPSQPAAR